jgi:hypothetical protein
MALDLVGVYQYHSPKKNHHKTPFITLVLRCICNFSYSMMYLFQHKYTSYVQVYKCLLEFFINKLV